MSSLLTSYTPYAYLREMEMATENGYTRFERARILGARALQLSEGAPALIETDATEPLEIARVEFDEGVVPIGVRRKV